MPSHHDDGRRCFLAGATGVIGRALTPLLLDRGFVVAGMTRSDTAAAALESQGVTPVVCDVYDAAALEAAVRAFRPDVIMHQLTDLPDRVEDLPTRRADNARMRDEGTRNLVAAARAVDRPRFLAQSIAWSLEGEAAERIAAHEQMVRSVGGVVLRYGQFYGPGTFYAEELPDHPRIEVRSAAARTLDYVDADSGVYEITDAPDVRPERG